MPSEASSITDDFAERIAEVESLVRNSQLLGILRKRPCSQTVYGGKVIGDGARYSGAYEPETQTVYVAVDDVVFGQSLAKRREPETVSSLASDFEGAVARVIVHEIGHHIHETTGSSARQLIWKAWRHPDRRPISTYADEDPENYFSECLAAFVFHRRELANRDPIGHDSVKAVLAIAEELPGIEGI